MPNPTEFQSGSRNLDNEKQSRELIGAVASRGNFAVNTYLVTTTPITLDARYSCFIIQSGASGGSGTLQPVSYWGTNKSARITVLNLSGGSWTLNADSADGGFFSTTGVLNSSLTINDQTGVVLFGAYNSVPNYWFYQSSQSTMRATYFNAGTTVWNWPTGVEVAFITLQAAGGGGGGTGTSGTGNAGSGGSGEFISRFPIYRNGASTITFVVGAGGTAGTAGGTGGTGGTGGDTSANSALNAAGGLGGVGTNSGTAGNGGKGGGTTGGTGGSGTGVAGTYNGLYILGGTSGGGGGFHSVNPIGFKYASVVAGGTSVFGVGGASGVSSNGFAAPTTSYGAGGGGANGISHAGGGGADGFAIVEY